MRLRIIAVAVILLAAWGINAQEAAVVELSAYDTAEVKTKWDALQAAQRDWDAINKRIKREYLVVKEGDKEASNTLSESSAAGYFITSSCDDTVIYFTQQGKMTTEETESCKKKKAEEEKHRPPALYERRGWESGFEFSKDFRFIVPARHVTSYGALTGHACDYVTGYPCPAVITQGLTNLRQ